MGHLVSKFRRRFCRWRRRRPLPDGCHPVAFPVHCDDALPSRDHPAAPAPVVRPGHRLPHRDRAPVASGFYIAPRRPCPLPQTARYPVGLLPSVNWTDPPKKPVLSARNSRMFGPSRTVHIPLARCRFSLLPSPPEQGVTAERPGPSGTTPRPCRKEVAVTVLAESPEWMEKDRNNLAQNSEQNGQSSSDKSGDLPLTPGSLKTQGVLTPRKRPTEAALGGGPAPSAPISPTPSEETGGEGPARPSARRQPRKRKRPEPPLPPLPCDPGELPPPPKVPRLVGDTNRGPSQSTWQSRKVLEDQTRGAADSGAAQPSPSGAAPGPAVADTLPPATEPGRFCATVSAGAAADRSSRPVFHGDEDCQMDTTPARSGAAITPSDDDVEMDTTPPCYAATILSSPNCDVRFLPVYQIQYRVEHRRPAGAPPAHPH